PCAPSAGPMPSRTRTWASGRRWAASRPRASASWARTGVPGAATPHCICGRVWRKDMRETMYSYCDSPFVELLLTSDGTALTGVYLPDGRHALSVAPEWRREDDLSVFAATREQLGEYFRGLRTGFELPLDARGTEFQRRVWEELARIPF